MENLKMQSKDIQQDNVTKIKKLFPNCITEAIDENGKYKEAINFELLKQMLSDEVLDGDEAYEFTWVGKKDSIVEANKPIQKTLRPCKEESLNWDKTENLYIEGDNLEVLKLLQESYLNKIKMIYIDPPYNTGNDFLYNDDFKIDYDDFLEESGEVDELGNRLFKNTDSNGRFHSDWCSMIYSRLMIARNLLSEDGVIFISIDERENSNLRNICDEIFGEKNYVQEIIWEKKFSPQNDAKYFSLNHEQLYCYAKNKSLFSRNLLPMTEEQIARYKNLDDDSRGLWISSDLTVPRYTPKDIYPVTSPSGMVFFPSNGRSWKTSKEKMEKLIEENRVWFGINGDHMPRLKNFISETNQGMVPISIWKHEDVGHTQGASQDLKTLFDNKQYFDYPKPVDLIKKALLISSNKNSIVLDFFSGSATTAHSVMQLNAEDKGKRKFIMVQLPEPCDEKSEAYKAGYKNICEIGKERIRRAGKKIKEENGLLADDLDTGFRVFKVDSSNMKDVYYSANEYSQNLLDALESNIKDDRTDLDLFFGCILDWGLPLNLPYISENINGCQVHTYNDGDLIACFNESIPDDVIKEIAKRQPLRVVFRDSSFDSSPAKINVEEIFKLLAPDTKVKVI